MNLQPGNSFTVVRQIANHLDSATYYVRAVIRNAYTDDIITTLNLTDKGGQRFSKNWQVPADPSGQGFFISIVTSVYTDSGYTSKSPNYGDEEDTYLVQDRVIMRGGGSLDAYTVRRMLQEELAKLPQPEPVQMPAFPSIPKYEMRWDEVLSGINSIKDAISKLPTNTVDLQPILSRLQSLQTAIEQKPVTPPTDITPVASQLQSIAEDFDAKVRQILVLMKTFEDELGKKLLDQFGNGITDKLAQIVKGTTFSIGPSQATMNAPIKQPATKEEKGVPFDPSSLAL